MEPQRTTAMRINQSRGIEIEPLQRGEIGGVGPQRHSRFLGPKNTNAAATDQVAAES